MEANAELIGEHGAFQAAVIDDWSNPMNRLVRVKEIVALTDKNGRDVSKSIVLTGSEMESLVEWWTKEKTRVS